MSDILWADLPAEQGPFFRILQTTPRSQTGFMTIAPGEEAGPPEVHEGSDQVFYIVRGKALMRVWADGPDRDPLERQAPVGTVVGVPAGIRHWVKSVGTEPLLFLTVYGPPAY